MNMKARVRRYHLFHFGQRTSSQRWNTQNRSSVMLMIRRPPFSEPSKVLQVVGFCFTHMPLAAAECKPNFHFITGKQGPRSQPSISAHQVEVLKGAPDFSTRAGSTALGVSPGPVTPGRLLAPRTPVHGFRAVKAIHDSSYSSCSTGLTPQWLSGPRLGMKRECGGQVFRAQKKHRQGSRGVK